MKTAIKLLSATIIFIAVVAFAGDYNGRSVLVAIGDGASVTNRYLMARWVNAKVWDLTDREGVIELWAKVLHVRHKVKTNQTARLRCINIDLLHADGRLKHYIPDEQLELKVYQAATNIMGSDAKYVWCDVTDEPRTSFHATWEIIGD